MVQDTVNDRTKEAMSETATNADEAAQDGPAGAASKVFENMRGTRDALSVRRVFGEPYTIGDATIIPVARVAGGAGGGGGEGQNDKEEASEGATGSGFGGGFGIGAYPVGVYEVVGGEATWKPAVDINRVIKGGQVLTGIIAVCVALVFWSRR